MTATQNLPFETDTRLGALYGQASQLTDRITSSADWIRHQVLGEKKIWVGRKQVWETYEAPTRTLARAEARGAGNERLPLKLRADLTERNEVHARITELDQVYIDAGGWSRFFLVTSSDGHIHSSMHCSTCRPTTEFGWHPELSGMTEADAVAQLGPTLCSVCFPTAPTHWTLTAAQVKAAADKAAGTYCQAGPREYSDPTQHRYGRTNYATCNGCGYRATLTSADNMRKHRPAK